MSDLFYEHGKIRVTKNVFSNGRGENFMVANIKHLRDERKGKSLFPLVAGAILGIVANVHIFFPYSDYAISGVGSLLVMQYFMAKDTFNLYITTPQAEVKAFSTKKEAVFFEVARALKRAMAAQKI